MTLTSFIHVTDTERNISCKFLENCYNKYTVHYSSGNIGITNCTTATGTINFTLLFLGL